MEIRRYIEVSEKLRRLLEEAEKQAKEIVAQAEERAEKMISEAQEEVKGIIVRTETGQVLDEMIREAEEEAEKEAERVLEEYERKISTLKDIPPERFERATELVLRGVLPQ